MRGLFLEFGALVSAAFLIMLALPGVIQAAEEPQAERPEWLRPLGDEAGSSTVSDEESSGDYKAGWSKLEPGVLDVQAWDWLQMDLDRLIEETSSRATRRLSAAQFEEKYLGATDEFLQIDADGAKTFHVAVQKALDEMEGARAEMQRRAPKLESGHDETAALLESRTNWAEYRKAQGHATRHPLALLEELPRHELLRETILKWLLRLAYGISAAAQ